MKIRNLSDDDLLKSLISLNSNEIQTVAAVLLHLIEIDKRRLYAVRGYSSLFNYCVEALKYCDGMAGRRVIAARCIRDFPSLLKLFMDQSLTLTSIVLISKILTKQNEREILNAVVGKRKTEVEKYVAGFLPEKNIREGIKALPSLVREQPGIDDQNPSVNFLPSSHSSGGVGNLLESQEKVQREINFEIKLKASDSAVNKLRRVQEIRGNKESLGDLFELLLDEYIEKHSPEARIKRREDRKNRGKGIKMKLAVQAKTSRYISKAIRDQIYIEGEGQCAFVSAYGKRCEGRKYLQIDHVYPFGVGGGNDMQNLRLLCPAHNRLAAEQFYGRDKVGELESETSSPVLRST